MLNSWQHLSLVVQCLVLATVIALVVAAVCYRSTFLTSVANNVSAVGLTIPSFALIGLLIIPLGFGVAPAVAVVTFFAVLPILRNAVVGLTEVDPALVEAARSGATQAGVKTIDINVRIPDGVNTFTRADVARITTEAVKAATGADYVNARI